jgi:hypothetical protein
MWATEVGLRRTYLLHREHVSWRYYVTPGYEPDCFTSGPGSGVAASVNVTGQTVRRSNLGVGVSSASPTNMCNPVVQSPKTPGYLESAAVFRDRQAGPAARGYPAGQWLLSRGAVGTTRRRDLDRAEPGRLPVPAGRCQRGSGVGYAPDQRDHAQPRLVQHRHLPLVGRLPDDIRSGRCEAPGSVAQSDPVPGLQDGPQAWIQLFQNGQVDPCLGGDQPKRVTWPHGPEPWPQGFDAPALRWRVAPKVQSFAGEEVLRVDVRVVRLQLAERQAGP